MAKPKSGSKDPAKDRCQTPYYAVDPLLPFLPAGLPIWEPAQGEGQLRTALVRSGYDVFGGDILTGQNYFEVQPPIDNYIQVTNPPFSLKYKWLHRAYNLGRPFAPLMPADTLFAERANSLFAAYGIEIIFVNPRISFKMPNLGYSGAGAQFATAWFTWGLDVGRMVTFAKVPPIIDSEWQSPLERGQL
jgi:hypothetical protein